MKILYLHQYFAFPSNNGNTRSYDLSKKFIENGHEVIMISTSAFLNDMDFDKGWTVIEREGIQLHILKSEYSNRLSFFDRILRFIKFFVLASIRIIKIKADVVLATSTPITIGVPALVKKIISGTPYIFEVRDVWPEVPIAMGVIKRKWQINLLKKFEYFIYRQAEAIVALSVDMKKSVERTGIAPQKVKVITNLSELTRFAPENIQVPDQQLLPEELQTKKHLVLYAGTLGFVNGIEYMVDLAEKFYRNNEKDIAFVVVGDGIEKEKVEQKAAQVGVLNNNFYLLPPVSKSQLPYLYSKVSVASSFVIPIPALWANSASKYFDSLAASKPILINYGGWQKTDIETKNLGVCLPPDIGQMQQAYHILKDFLQNEEQLKQAGENARKLASEQYSLEVATQKYLQIFEEIKYKHSLVNA